MRFKMDDGKIVDTEVCLDFWREKQYFNGKNYVGLVTRQEFASEELYKSKSGRYYIVSHSQWQGTSPSARWVLPREAATWLLMNESLIPDDLVSAARDCIE